MFSKSKVITIVKQVPRLISVKILTTRKMLESAKILETVTNLSRGFTKETHKFALPGVDAKHLDKIKHIPAPFAKIWNGFLSVSMAKTLASRGFAIDFAPKPIKPKLEIVNTEEWKSKIFYFWLYVSSPLQTGAYKPISLKRNTVFFTSARSSPPEWS